MPTAASGSDGKIYASSLSQLTRAFPEDSSSLPGRSIIALRRAQALHEILFFLDAALEGWSRVHALGEVCKLRPPRPIYGFAGMLEIHEHRGDCNIGNGKRITHKEFAVRKLLRQIVAYLWQVFHFGGFADALIRLLTNELLDDAFEEERPDDVRTHVRIRIFLEPQRAGAGERLAGIKGRAGEFVLEIVADDGGVGERIRFRDIGIAKHGHLFQRADGQEFRRRLKWIDGLQ